MRSALVVTHSRDVFVPERVIEELARRGVRPHRVDTDRFPAELRMSTGRGPDFARIGDLDLAAVCAVWWRRVYPAAPEGLEPGLAEVCRLEGEALVEGLLLSLPGVQHVNHPAADRAAAHKLHQLQVAGALGLAVPPTLVSNDPAAIRAFCDAHPACVTKLLTVNAVRGQRAYTQRVGAAELADLSCLQASPMLLQAEIPKQIELRVAVVGDVWFAGGIRAAVGAGPVDWRHPDANGGDWEPWTLDAAIGERLVALNRALGLVYGGVDLIVKPDGEVVFLEVNSFGEWGMLERSLGLPVAAALADALVADPRGPLRSRTGV